MSPLRRRKKTDRSTDGTMSLMEHLYELRKRLMLAVVGVVLGGIVGFVWYTVGIPALSIRPLGDILIQPYCDVPAPPRQTFGSNECSLLATQPFSILSVRMKAALMAGLVISCPIWLYQLWAFVTPALYSRERRFAITFVVSAALLFVVGTVLAYLVIPEGLKVLLGFGGDTTTAALSPDSYYSFLMSLLVIFGLSFEVPLLLVMLNFAGIVTGARLAKSRRYAIFGMVVLAALVVPGNEPISMLALAVALAVLYEVAVQIAKLHDRRKAKALVAAGLGELSDDEASPLPGLSGTADAPPIAGPGPVEQAGPVAPADDPNPWDDAT